MQALPFFMPISKKLRNPTIPLKLALCSRKCMGKGNAFLYPFSCFFDSDQVQSLAASLKEALAQLPTEQPPGSEDIYGLDIGISYLSDDFLWQNGKGKKACMCHGS